MENSKENQNLEEITDNIQSDNTYNDDFNYSYQDDEIKNLCLDCGVDMGPTNPRQLCGKTHCNNL